MSATHAAIIFSLEPVFATAFAVAARGASESLGGRGWVGAALVLAGVVVSELRGTDTARRAQATAATERGG
jgi:drug/metabolite transporter (DMT)-like permease